MSIHHRYALYYSCLRYLSDIEKVKDIASGCNMIDDIQEKTPASSTAGLNSRLDVAGVRAEDDSGDYENDDKQKDITNFKAHNHGCDTANTDSVPHRCQGLSLSGSLAHSAFKIGLGEEDPCAEDFHKSESTPTISRDEKTTSTICTTIRKSQFEKLMVFHQILTTIVASLRRNLKRVEAEGDCASTSLISHLYYEAARLNGSEPARTPRMQRMLGLNWWHSDLDDLSHSEDTHSRCKSPLLSAFEPGDLVWGDQVVQWQQDLGSTKDGRGCRFVKI